MTLTCFVCQEPESPEQPLAVCHHCGRPVCRRDRVWIEDPVFAGLGEPWTRAAHCKECHGRRHPKTAAQAEPAAPRTTAGTTPPPLPPG